MHRSRAAATRCGMLMKAGAAAGSSVVAGLGANTGWLPAYLHRAPELDSTTFLTINLKSLSDGKQQASRRSTNCNWCQMTTCVTIRAGVVSMAPTNVMSAAREGARSAPTVQPPPPFAAPLCSRACRRPPWSVSSANASRSSRFCAAMSSLQQTTPCCGLGAAAGGFQEIHLLLSSSAPGVRMPC